MIIDIPKKAIEIIDQSKIVLIERDRSYNNNDVNYHDYKLQGIEDTWKDILECYLRLWNTGNPDKAVDWTNYSALQSACIMAGMPQSRFSPLFNAFLSKYYSQQKEIDKISGINLGNPAWIGKP